MLKIKNYKRHPLTLEGGVTCALSLFPSLILAGGAIRDSLKNRKIVDYDLFFLDLSFKGRVKEYFIELGYQVVFACPLGLLYSLKKDDVKVQLICKRSYSSVEDLLSSFDFSICQYALTHTGVITTTWQAIEDNKKMKLTLVALEYPSATINRISKYKEKGFYTGFAIREIVLRLANMAPDQYDESTDSLYVD